MTQQRIYLDNHATTPVDPRVFNAMAPFFTEIYGNPASKNHSFGSEAKDAVDTARRQIAVLIGAQPKEIIFTSGATESNNLAIKGVAETTAAGGAAERNHIVTLATEHKAVLDPCRRLESSGFAVTYLQVRENGLVDLEELYTAVHEQTMLISVMHANNEIGVIQPLAKIGSFCRQKGIVFHVDAAQSIGKVPVDVSAMKIDLLSISGHKVYGPKGIGALFVRSGAPVLELRPQMDGGGHERGFRAGTLPTPLIVGLGLACELAGREMESEAASVGALRQMLLDGITTGLHHVSVNGDLEQRLPGNLNLTFKDVEAESLLQRIPHIALSTGSACTTANLEPSHVLKALGLRHEAALSSVRFGLGRFTTREEVEIVIEAVVAAVKSLRASSLIPDFS